ncbi:MAG: SDR family oxidoreductase, partial [Stellaceae bacterium]
VQADVADPDAVRRMVGAESELGPVSILVNNAGLSSPATLERTMVGRTGRPEDIANAVAFLSAPESGFVTAQVLTIDGGRMDCIGHGYRRKQWRAANCRTKRRSHCLVGNFLIVKFWSLRTLQRIY